MKKGDKQPKNAGGAMRGTPNARETPDAREERLFALIARRYEDAAGEELLRELEGLRQGDAVRGASGDAAHGARDDMVQAERQETNVVRVDRLFWQKRRAQNMRRFFAIAAPLAAACLAVALVAPWVLRGVLPSTSSGENAGLSQSEDMAAVLETTAAATAAAQPVNPAPTASSDMESEAPSTADAEIIPLHFDAGGGFTVEEALLDNGKSVYIVGDALQDDVVVTLEYADAPRADGLAPVALAGGVAAYGKYGADYSLLTYEQGGVVYELTCQYDINTLIRFSDLLLGV